MIYQYRPLEQDEYIVIGADPSEGGDYSTFTAISKKNSDVVMVGHSKEESSQLGYTLNHVGIWIKNQTGHFPVIAPENNVGAATISRLKDLNYPNIYRMPSSFIQTDDEQSKKYGWSTNVASRPKMLDDLALAIRQRVLTIPSKQIIDELFTFIRHIKTGKPQADTGCNDDLVFSTAIAWQLVQTTSTPDSYQTSRVAKRNIENKTKWSI